MNETAVDTTTIMNGRKTIMIGSNNYLGLTAHPEVKAAAVRAVEKYGTSCTGSRFLNGTLDLHVELEEKLAKFMKKEAALVFTTGFTTNVGVISTLVQKGDVVISDRTNHASILDGCRLSYGKMLKFRHNDMEDLERILVNLKDKNCGKLIVVDGVFSMEGDVADLKRIVALAKKYGAQLMVDEAHGLGVLGKTGRGTCEEAGVLDKVDLVMGTFSKSFASIGGFIAGEAKVISYLKHHSRAFIFQAAPPPSAMAATLKALEILQREPERLTKLRSNVAYMYKAIQDMGFRTWPTESAIVTIIVGDNLKTFQLSKMLEEEGVYVNPVVSPAVPPQFAGIRTSYTATHKRAELDFALEKLKKVGTALNLIGSGAPGAPIVILGVPLRRKTRFQKLSKPFRIDGAQREPSLQEEFLKLPFALYQSDKNWVPPMIGEAETVFTGQRNAVTDRGDVGAFLAKRGDEFVGRIVAAVGRHASGGREERSGYFGFFEADRDFGAAEGLLAAARDWLAERGAKTMRGPVSFSPLNGMGCLVEGFDHPAAIMMPYNPDYYPEYFEKYGLKKAEDFYAYQIDSKNVVRPRLEKLARYTLDKGKIAVRRVHMSRLRGDLSSIMEILNDGAMEDSGLGPLDKKGLKYLSAKLKPYIEPELVNFIEVNGKAAAFSMLLPDYNEVMRRFNGRVRMMDMLRFHRYSKKIKSVRFALLGVRKSFRHRGLETLLYLESLKNAQELGYHSGEVSSISENNQTLNKTVVNNGGARYKAYRLYEMEI
jgi:8-amino-7-oxononanoate synthase